MANIIDKKINPEIPIVQESNRNEVYLPKASYTNIGVAGFYKTHFIVDDNGIVHLRKAPERDVSAITYDSNTNTLVITFDDGTIETIKLNDCGCVDGTDILVYDVFKVINFKETSWYDTSTGKVLIISAAETGYDNDELVCQLDKYNAVNTNVNDNVITSNYQSNYEYQIYKCTDGSVAIFANDAFAGRFIILKREFAVQKNVANITYDDTTGILTVYYVTGDKQNILLDRAITDIDFPNGDFENVQYSIDDGITLEGTAKAKYKDGTETDVNVTFDIPLVPADDTAIIDRAEEAETKKVLIKATKGLKAIQSTDDGGLEFTLSDGTKLQAGSFVTVENDAAVYDYSGTLQTLSALASAVLAAHPKVLRVSYTSIPTSLITPPTGLNYGNAFYLFRVLARQSIVGSTSTLAVIEVTFENVSTSTTGIRPVGYIRQGKGGSLSTWWWSGWTSDEFQEKLVSGTNIKTVNGASLLGSGNIVINTEVTKYAYTTTTDDWTAQTGGKYTYTISANTHGVGIYPVVTVFNNGAEVSLGVSVDSSGNVTLTSTTADYFEIIIV